MLSDYAFKIKRGIPANGNVPLETYTFDTQTSDTSDYQDGGTPAGGRAAACKQDKGHDVSKRKVWRRKRKQSACKEDKSKESSFADKIVNTNHLARRLSLPPLNSVSPSLTPASRHHHHVDDDDGQIAAGKEDLEVPLDLSRDSTPRPVHSTTPISPNGTLSPEVTELIESVVRSSFRRSHRRNGSTGSIERSLRPKTSSKSTSLEASPLKTHVHSRATSHRHSLASDKMDANTSSRISPEVSISYLGGSPSSDEDQPDTPRLNLNSEFVSEEGSKIVSNGGKTVEGLVVPILYSNDSSMDTHESDREDNDADDADAECTSDGMSDNVFNRFSGTEPNETASPSSQAESDEPTSHSNPDLSDAVSDAHTHSSLPGQSDHKELDRKALSSDISEDQHHSDSPRHQRAVYSDPYPLQYPVSDNILTSTALLSGSWYEESSSGQANEAEPIAFGEEYHDRKEKASPGLEQLSIPLHIRRDMSPDKYDDGK